MTNYELVAGVDPGKSGAVAYLTMSGKIHSIVRMDETEDSLAQDIYKHSMNCVLQVVEKVHSMPRQGVSSSFKFGYMYGLVCGILALCGKRRIFVSPVKWMTIMGCRTKGDKNITKQAAEQLFGDQVKITHRNADALLIAEYARRLAIEMNWTQKAEDIKT